MNGLRKCDVYTQRNFIQHKDEILLFVGKWMGLENIMLSEVIQVQKAKGYMFSLLCELQT
jgi:hypothetical protein